MSADAVLSQSILKDVPFLILAGGLGTRLGEYCQNKPKALVEVAGEPFLAHLLRLLKREGVSRVVLLTHHLEEQIQEFAGDGSIFGLAITYSRDETDNFGTGAAVAKAFSSFDDSQFAVIYGDTYLDIPMSLPYEKFKALDGAGLMTVLENRNQWQKSNVEFNESTEKIVRYEKSVNDDKMHFIDFGLSFFKRETFEKEAQVHRGASFDLGQIFQSMAKSSNLDGYAVNRRFYDVTNLESLIETRAYLSQNQLWQFNP